MQNELRKEDFGTQCWKRLSKAISDEIDRLRKTNDAVSNTEIKTAAIRGQILALNKILDLAKASSGSDAVPRNWEEAQAFPTSDELHGVGY